LVSMAINAVAASKSVIDKIGLSGKRHKFIAA
jgi:hypothetical protein